MKRIAGIDFSSKAVDIVTLSHDDNDPRWRRIDLTGWQNGSFAATLRVRGRMRGTTSFLEDVSDVYIEQPYSRGRVQTAFVLGRIQGAVLASLPQSLTFYEIGASEWRRKLCGSGVADKEQVEGHLRSFAFQLPDTADHNAWEALAIAVVGRDEIGHALELARAS